MTETINKRYFNWLVSKIGGEKASERLLTKLHERRFTYTIDMDGNREIDGIELRYRFGSEMKHSQYEIANWLDVRPCSVLEMMIALFLRCEEQIINDPDLGNLTGFLFWNSIASMGLSPNEYERFDEERVDRILDIFLERGYEADGTGGMFTIKDGRHDLRHAEIWYQAMWYINDILKEM